jgi:hypothetical protein
MLELRNAAPPAAPAAAPAPPTRLLTPDEIAEWSPEMISVVQRAAREIYEPVVANLRGRLDRLEQGFRAQDATVKQVAQVTAQTAEDKFEADLTANAGGTYDWKAINNDPNFLDFLQQADTFSGKKRHDLFLEAAGQLDAGRVSAFFGAYAQAKGIAAARPLDGGNSPGSSTAAPTVDPLSLVAPGPAAPAPAASVPAAGKIWTQAEVLAPYDDYHRGAITEQEFKVREAAALKAVAEGRVRG